MLQKILVLFTLMLAASISRADGIIFENDKTFAQLLAEAKRQNKLVFIDCYTVWCGPCKRLAAMVFPDSAVGAFFNSHFINAKFDMERGEGIEIANRYGIRAYPTLLWLDGDGNVVHKLVGGTDAAGLIAQGQKAIDPTPGILTGYRKRYNDGDRNPDFLCDFLNTLHNANENYEQYFKEYLDKLTAKELSDKKHTQTIFNLTKDVRSPGIAYISKNRDYYIGLLGSETVNKKINQLAAKAVTDAYKTNDVALYEAAMDMLKAFKFNDAAEQGLKLSLEYYARTNNWVKYDETATTYIKKYAAKNYAAINDICWNYYLNINDRAQLIKAAKWAYNVINAEQKYTYCLTYAYLVYKLEDYKEAEKACDYAILRAKEEGVNDSSATMLKEAIKKSLYKN
ncbi:MAG: thioredoxin domain-containing protein [Chitinophagales bacterium]|nr:thioredoxin domain-containing protein [Chitinophagales bacterium]MDW8418661.1 thioredoxin domain-containing protein [Chitinophagales bacterium]